MSTLPDRIKALFLPEPCTDKHYYALTILLSKDGGLEFSSQTAWVGYTESKPRREIRKASLVHADRMLMAWKELGKSGMVIGNPEDMALFLAFGGNAVVEQTLAESVIPDWLAPIVSVNVGEWGFASPGLLGGASMKHAPTPKHRMRIIQRDNYRCRICGRSPNEHVDLELHVHHIRPWAMGGVTVNENLITLCHTCHNGLDPHYECGLFRLLPKNELKDRAAVYKDQLQRYQAAKLSPARELPCKTL